ncbi:hypothetical protein H8S44_02885 [Anaerosacchariphilus sp. NSJ-68]|uniref:Glycosyl transferase n=2 Tax=Lachnospiraceae TaxID=186803 RepID=A0A923RL04_9FIRM|nr:MULTISPECIES: glycosyltransferase [Lachnospiraceae]MBC5658719.1 hypothetical protein [Anaerosacchariphilus hominis]MBC5699012.1 hypothetical protein [Roseburia difficilis]
MKKRAIVTGGSKDQFPAIAVLIMQIANNCPDMADEIVIFHNGVEEEEQIRINKIFPCRFIEYTFPISDDGKFGRAVWHYFTFMLFCKYECFRLLDEYETILWTDYDVYILKNISELMEQKEYPAKFMTNTLTIKKFNENIYSHLDELKDVDLLYGLSISCGIFVLKDSFPNYKHFYEECIQLTMELSDSLSCAEEAVISILLQRNKIKVGHIPPEIYCVHPKNYHGGEEIKILHAAGNPKFWNGLYYEPWQILMKQWIKMGGEKVKNNRFMVKRLIRDVLPYGVVDYLMKRRER